MSDRWHPVCGLFIVWWFGGAGFCVQKMTVRIKRSSSPHAAPHVEARHSQTFYRCASNQTWMGLQILKKQKQKWIWNSPPPPWGACISCTPSATSSSGESPMCIRDVSKRPSERPSADGRDVCKIWGVSKHVGRCLARVMKYGPSYVWVRSSEPADTPRWGMWRQKRAQTVQDRPLLSHREVKLVNNNEPDRKA